MEKGYFAAAWGDVTKSPGWASVVLRLGLLCLIPIFGVVSHPKHFEHSRIS